MTPPLADSSPRTGGTTRTRGTRASTADYRASLASEDGCLATGLTVCRDSEKLPGGAEYHNAFLLRFNASGEAIEYREWYMRRPFDE